MADEKRKNYSREPRVKSCPECGLACGVAKHICEQCGFEYIVAGGMRSSTEMQRAALISLATAARAVIIHVQREKARYGESLNSYPGHAHNEPGRWDKDGSICRECLDWQKLILATERVHIPRKPKRVNRC